MNPLLIYDTSPFNPLLKILYVLVFLVVLEIYIYTRIFYSDKIRRFIDIMILFASSALIMGIIRFFGDGTQFGFTKDYSLEWFQDLAMVAAAGCLILAGRELLHLIEKEGK